MSNKPRNRTNMDLNTHKRAIRNIIKQKDKQRKAKKGVIESITGATKKSKTNPNRTTKGTSINKTYRRRKKAK